MASDDWLLPWDDQEILNFAEKLYAGKLFIFFMGFACKHKQKPNQKRSLGPGSAVSKGKKWGEGGGKGGGAWRHAFDGPPFHDTRLPGSVIFLSSLNFFRLFPHCGDWFQATKKDVYVTAQN